MSIITITKCTKLLKSALCNQLRLVVILGVLTDVVFCSSLIISQLLAKAIPVRGAKFKEARFLAGFLLYI
ncbi:hypothetical protein [Citrobacter koseri]|uniref:hypothetical protein n=1 Tax=Citrobacter koseri TaxID=545 RepID=UPI0040399CEE